MDRKIIGALLLFLATTGCCACDSSCDYLPPVLDGPYSSHGSRIGVSALADNYATPNSDDAVAPVEGEAITPLLAEE